MKENKVNIELIVPSIGEKYDLFVPVNKTVGEFIVILNQTINEITKHFPLSNNLSLFNVKEGIIYKNETEIINTSIKNGAILALI